MGFKDTNGKQNMNEAGWSEVQKNGALRKRE